MPCTTTGGEMIDLYTNKDNNFQQECEMLRIGLSTQHYFKHRIQVSDLGRNRRWSKLLKYL